MDESNYFRVINRSDNPSDFVSVLTGKVRIPESVDLRQRPRKYGVILSKMTAG